MAPARTPLPFFFFFVFFTLNLSLSLNLAASASKTKPRTPAPAPLSEAVVAELAQALQAAAGRGGPTNTYLAASLLLPHYLRPLTRSRITLLLPTDAVLFLHPSSSSSSSSSSSTSTSSAAMPLLSAMPPSQLRSLARFHMLTTNLTFANLLTLPKATLLPTLLGDAYRLRIDTTTAAAAAAASSSAAANFLIEGAHIIHPDICPPSLSHIVTCHGIDRLLIASSSSSSAPTTPTTPTSPSSTRAAAVAPASAPLASGDLLETASPDSSAAPASLPTTILRSYSNPSTSHRIIDAYVVVNGSYTAAAPPPPPPPASKSGVISSSSSTSLPSATADAIGSSTAAFSPAPAPLTASSSASAAKSPLALSQLLLLTLAGLVAVAAHTTA